MREVFSFTRGHAPRTIFRIGNFLFMMGLVVMMCVPLLKVLSDSFDRTTIYGLNLVPKNPSIEAYKTIFTNKNLYKPLLISILTTVSGTALGLAITTLGAYVLIQRKLIGRNFFAKFIFITMIFNGGLVPTFIVLKSLHLINTLWAVLLLPSVNVFNMVLMRSFFEQIPISIFESAEMDGCPPPRIFLQIVLPLSTSAIAAISLFFAVQYWNEFFNYVMYISDTGLYNFQIKLRELILSEQVIANTEVMGYGQMVKNAAVIIAIIPFMAIYPFCQRYFIAGVTMGAVKE
jgi:putative aldouronate transport system permease protein